MKYFALFAGLLALPLLACCAEPKGLSDTTAAEPAVTWPSQEQLDLVAARQQSFPLPNIVSNVDWYEPLEVVAGRRGRELPVVLTESPKIDAAVSLVEKYNSYAFIYWKDGAIRAEKYWPGFDKASRYDTASMHKTVVGLLLGIAQDEGLIDSVDDPLARYLPELEGTKRGRAPLRSLLEMASGIQNPPTGGGLANVSLQTYMGDDLKSALAHWPVPAEPFEEFFYAAANPQYLSWVIERVSGQRYAEYLSEKLWQPIGADDARVWLDHEGGSPRTSCCLQANARDWLKFGLLLLDQGKVGDQQVVSADWIDRMTAPSELNPNYGWQIWRGSPHNPARAYSRTIKVTVPAKEPFAQNDVVYLDGSGAQRVYVIPSENAVIVRIGQPSFAWDDSELPNLLLSTTAE